VEGKGTEGVAGERHPDAGTERRGFHTHGVGWRRRRARRDCQRWRSRAGYEGAAAPQAAAAAAQRRHRPREPLPPAAVARAAPATNTALSAATRTLQSRPIRMAHDGEPPAGAKG